MADKNVNNDSKGSKAGKQPKELNVDNYKVAKVVSLRNRFFYVLYRNAILVFLSSIATAIFAVLFLVFFATNPVSPRYIPLNVDGTYIKLSPISECKDDKEVQRFANDALKKLFRYDYKNYSSQLQEVADYFTPEGWDTFLTEYTRSGTLEAVKRNKWVVTGVTTEVPVVFSTFTDEYGRCVKDIKTTMNVQYSGERSQNPKHNIHIRVVRQSVIRNPSGLGIERVVINN